MLYNISFYTLFKKAMSTERFPHNPTISELLEFAKPPKPMDWLPDYFDSEFNVYNINWSAVHNGRLTYTYLIEYMFGSDEVATAQLFFFDDKPFMLVEKYGDRVDDLISIVNRDTYVEFAKFLLHLELDERLKKLETVDADKEMVIVPDQYIKFSNGDEGLAVHIESPKWNMGFKHMFNDHIAIYEGEVVSFVGWENPALQSWDAESEMIIVSTASGGQFVIDGFQISFVLKAIEPELSLSPY